ncbi:MAG: hypothetical protein OXF50_08880 [Caldilineaceae bacterium]|nr:hypothetical protein [Caldilineaceae bacterium]
MALISIAIEGSGLCVGQGGRVRPEHQVQVNPVGYYGENTGFVVAVNIKHAIEIIDANPIGFELPNA